MGFKERYSKIQARVLVYSSNDRSRKINKSRPSLAPRPEEQAAKQHEASNIPHVNPLEHPMYLQNGESMGSFVHVPSPNLVAVTSYPDPIERSRTCPIRTRAIRPRQQRYSMPVSVDPSGFQIFGPRDQLQHQRSNSHEIQYPMLTQIHIQTSIPSEIQNFDRGDTLSSPSLYDLSIPEDLEMQDAWPRFDRINSGDSSTFDMNDSGFLSMVDDSDIQTSLQNMVNYSTPQLASASPELYGISSNFLESPDHSQIINDFLGRSQINYDRQTALQSLEGRSSDPIYSEPGFIDQLNDQCHDPLNDQFNRSPFSSDWSFHQPLKQKIKAEPPAQPQERQLQIRRKKSVPLEPLFSCPYCAKYNGEKAFKRKDHLDQHLRTAHHMAAEDLYPAFCRYSSCEKSEKHCQGIRAFHSSRDFAEHLKAIHEESVFNCEYPRCGRKGKRGYSGKANLINHQRKVHGCVIGDPTKDAVFGNMN